MLLTRKRRTAFASLGVAAAAITGGAIVTGNAANAASDAGAAPVTLTMVRMDATSGDAVQCTFTDLDPSELPAPPEGALTSAAGGAESGSVSSGDVQITGAVEAGVAGAGGVAPVLVSAGEDGQPVMVHAVGVGVGEGSTAPLPAPPDGATVVQGVISFAADGATDPIVTASDGTTVREGTADECASMRTELPKP